LELAALASTSAEAAARLLGKAADLRAEIGERIPTGRPRDNPRESGRTPSPHSLATSIATEALGQDGFDAAHAEGRAMSLDDAIALALEVIDA
jgi:hypothetical protein